LLEHGADVNATNPRGHTVLYCAGGHGHLDTLRLLLHRGADRAAQEGLMEFLGESSAASQRSPLVLLPSKLRKYNCYRSLLEKRGKCFGCKGTAVFWPMACYLS
jgi:ankyrin repeat protein